VTAYESSLFPPILSTQIDDEMSDSVLHKPAYLNIILFIL